MTKEGWIFTSVMALLGLVGIVLLYITPFWDQGAGVADGQTVKVPSAKLEAAPVRSLEDRITERKIPSRRVAAPNSALNVVVVLANTQRRDQWSVYGHPALTTPFLREKAKRGVVMDDVITTAVEPHTAAPAFLTGQYPHRVGAVEPSANDNKRVTGNHAETLAERFAAAGWGTVGFTANHHHNRSAGMAQGFDWYRDAQPNAFMPDRREAAAQVVSAAIHRVGLQKEAWGDRPIYLQLALADSHRPYVVTSDQTEGFTVPDSTGSKYRVTVRRLDNALRKLVDGLSVHGLTDENTVFVVAGEHGEGLSMPVWHREQHGFVLYESSTRVPWVMWGGSVPEGKRESRLASAVDFAPTVAGLVGLRSSDEDGLDLSAAILGASSEWPREQAFSEARFIGVHRASLWTTDRQCQMDFGTTRSIPDDRFEDACYDRKVDSEFTTAIEDEVLMNQLVELHGALANQVHQPQPAPE